MPSLTYHLLKDLVSFHVIIRLKNQDVIKGKLLTFDGHLNLHLADAEEIHLAGAEE